MTNLIERLKQAECGDLATYRLSPKMTEMLLRASKCEPRPVGFYYDPRQHKAWSAIVGRWMLPTRPAMSLHALKDRGLAERKFIGWIGRCWFLTDDGIQVRALLTAKAEQPIFRPSEDVND